MHDLLFRNALIFDGEGSPPAVGDVAVTNGRIAAIGSKLGWCACEVIPADGLALMPGIIDSHTNPQAVFDDLDAIAAANTRGHPLIGQVSCCPLTMDPRH